MATTFDNKKSTAVKRKLVFDSSDDIIATLINSKKKKTADESGPISPPELARQVYETLYRRAAAENCDDDNFDPAEIAIRKVKEIRDTVRFGYNGDVSTHVSCLDDPMTVVADFGDYDIYLGKLAVENRDVPRGAFLHFLPDVRLTSARCLPAPKSDRVGLDPVTGRVLIEKILKEEEEEDGYGRVVQERRHYHVRVPPSRLWDARAAIYRLLYSSRSTTSGAYEGPLDMWLKGVELYTTTAAADASINAYLNVGCLDMYYSDTAELCPWSCPRFSQFVLVPLPDENKKTVKKILDDLLDLQGGHPFRPDVQFVFISRTTADDDDDIVDDDPRVITVTAKPVERDRGAIPPPPFTRPPGTWSMPDESRCVFGRPIKRMFL